MKKRVLKKLSSLFLILLVALALTACTPDTSLHTGDGSSETVTTDNQTIASTEEKTESSTPPKTNNNSSVEHIINSSEAPVTSSNPDTDSSQSTSSKPVNSTTSTDLKITYEKAKSIALENAGVKEADIRDFEIELDRDDGVTHYDISFEVDGKDYEYDIDAQSGKIISYKKPKSTSSESTSTDTISKSKAKSIALKDAGLKEDQIYDYEIEYDYEKGTPRYEISFEYDGKDYDYEINAKTGKIIAFEKPKVTSPQVKISEDKAKSTALNHAGVKADDIKGYKIDLEKDNGVLKYEISFRKGNTEYDYTINAENGKIIESEKDTDD